MNKQNKKDKVSATKQLNRQLEELTDQHLFMALIDDELISGGNCNTDGDLELTLSVVKEYIKRNFTSPRTLPIIEAAEDAFTALVANVIRDEFVKVGAAIKEQARKSEERN